MQQYKTVQNSTKQYKTVQHADLVELVGVGWAQTVIGLFWVDLGILGSYLGAPK